MIVCHYIKKSITLGLLASDDVLTEFYLVVLPLVRSFCLSCYSFFLVVSFDFGSDHCFELFRKGFEFLGRQDVNLGCVLS